eukprot:3826945-Amphidinium_carterae.2
MLRGSGGCFSHHVPMSALAQGILVDDEQTPAKVQLASSYMACCLRHGCWRLYHKNQHWSTALVSALFGQMDRHSSDPQHRRCGVGCFVDTQERAWLYRSQGSNSRENGNTVLRSTAKTFRTHPEIFRTFGT